MEAENKWYKTNYSKDQERHDDLNDGKETEYRSVTNVKDVVIFK